MVLDTNAIHRMQHPPEPPAPTYAEQVTAWLDTSQLTPMSFAALQFSPSGYGFGWTASPGPVPSVALCCLVRPEAVVPLWSQVTLGFISQRDPTEAVLSWLARLPEAQAVLAAQAVPLVAAHNLPANLGAALPAGWHWHGTELTLRREFMPVLGPAQMMLYSALPPGGQLATGLLVRWIRTLAARMLARKALARALAGPLKDEWL